MKSTLSVSFLLFFFVLFFSSIKLNAQTDTTASDTIVVEPVVIEPVVVEPVVVEPVVVEPVSTETAPAVSISTETPAAASDTYIPAAKKWSLKPSLGLGAGMLSFYGDISNNSYRHPLVSRLAYIVSLSTPMTDYLDVNFFGMWGKTGANEKSLKRNLNFESDVRTVGMLFSYNFSQLLKPNHFVEPFISLGVESFEFSSKTDIKDGNGDKYYFWDDGSIRKLNQKDPKANEVGNDPKNILRRDYSYETDIREADIDGFGKYSEWTVAFPVGIGVKMKMTDHIDFKIGTTMHLTLTDYVDGITKKSGGENNIDNRAGNAKNDKFLMTSFSISYNLFARPKSPYGYDEELFEEVDFAALDAIDTDGDGVTDANDKCQGTPAGEAVDLNGCPLDDDNDGVPNYKDQEKETPAGSMVTQDGVQLTDSIIAKLYLAYEDTTGEYTKIVTTKFEAEVIARQAPRYKVELGRYTTGIPPNLINAFLSIPDIQSTTVDDSVTVYTVGNYATPNEAIARKNEMVKRGIPNASVVLQSGGKIIPDTDGRFVSAVNLFNKEAQAKAIIAKSKGETISDAVGAHTEETLASQDPENTVVFRVQLGAYSKPLSKNIFNNTPNLVSVKGEDNLTRYFTGSSPNYEGAAKHKIDMLLGGFEGAFVVAFRNGKRVPLESLGAIKAATESVDGDASAGSAIDKNLIKFKVQLGAFKNVTPEIMERFKDISNTEQFTTSTGLIKLLTGSFGSLNEASNYKNEIASKFGIEGAFIVAFFKGESIPVQEAVQLLKQ